MVISSDSVIRLSTRATRRATDKCVLSQGQRAVSAAVPPDRLAVAADVRAPAGAAESASAAAVTMAADAAPESRDFLTG